MRCVGKVRNNRASCRKAGEATRRGPTELCTGLFVTIFRPVTSVKPQPQVVPSDRYGLRNYNNIMFETLKLTRPVNQANETRFVHKQM